MKIGDLLLCKIKYAPEVRGWVDDDRYFRPNQEYMITNIDGVFIYVAFEQFSVNKDYDLWYVEKLWNVFYTPQEIRKFKLEKIKKYERFDKL